LQKNKPGAEKTPFTSPTPRKASLPLSNNRSGEPQQFNNL
jgi:hypothetical protein